MSYYYELVNKRTGEIIYECDTPFETAQDALTNAKKITIGETLWRVFTTPPGRSLYEEPQHEDTISAEFESESPILDTKLMLSIHSAVRNAVEGKQRTLTPDEIDEAILGVTGWDIETDAGAEALAEAYELVVDRRAHIFE